MAYKISYEEWVAKTDAIERENYRHTDTTKRKPVPMQPVEARLLYNTGHFVIMKANTTPAHGWKRRGCRYALIELTEVGKLPTRIDARLKSVRHILAIREVLNLNHKAGPNIEKRYRLELQALIDKCERLYPCHFLVKGIDYEPPKTYLGDSTVLQEKKQAQRGAAD